jgi:hypothetical protein
MCGVCIGAHGGFGIKTSDPEEWQHFATSEEADTECFSHTIAVPGLAIEDDKEGAQYMR